MATENGNALVVRDNDDMLVVRDNDGTEYSLIEGPGKHTKYVVAALDKLTNTLQLKELAVDLANVGKFILMAHCGVMGHIQLELKVRERLNSVVELCDDTVFTLNEFDRASGNAITNMATAYEYLVEGFEDIALETLQDVAETSKNMAMESSKLEQRFGNEVTKVKEVYTETKIERSEVEKANIKTTKDIKLSEKEQSDREKAIKEAKAEEQRALQQLEKTLKEENDTAEERRKIAKQLENRLNEVQKKFDEANVEAITASNQESTGFWSAVGSRIVHAVGGKTKDDRRKEKVAEKYKGIEQQHQDVLTISKEQKEAEDKKAQLLKEQRELHAKELEDRRKKREEERKQMVAIARKLAEAKFEEDIQVESLHCLHHAVTALGSLQSIMKRCANFWREIHSACNAVTGNAMVKRLDTLKTMEVERRKRLWNAKGFKMEAVKYYAQWVAIQQMCSTSRIYLTNSQGQVHMFIRQNPTKEEGKKLLQVLARDLAKLDIEQPELEDAKKDDKKADKEDEKKDD